MAHGTGLYKVRMYKHEIQTDEYSVRVYRTYDYYYPTYSDSYEPTSEALDEFQICVAKYEPDRKIPKAWMTAYFEDGVDTGTITKDEANKILWNIKNRNISYEAIEQYFKALKA